MKPICRAWACAIDVVTAAEEHCNVFSLEGVQFFQYFSRLYGEITKKYYNREVMADTDNVNELMTRIGEKSSVFSLHLKNSPPSESLEPFINLLVGDDKNDNDHKIIQAYIDIKTYEAQK